MKESSKEIEEESLIGKCLYFKTLSNDKAKIGTIKQIKDIDGEGMLVVVICNGEEYRLVFASPELIQKSANIATQLLIKKRETLQDFFENGKDKKMIEDLKKKVKSFNKRLRGRVRQKIKAKQQRRRKKEK